MAKAAQIVLTTALTCVQIFAVPVSLSASLKSALQENGKVDILVSMKEKTLPVLSEFKGQTFTTREARLTQIAISLQSLAATSQSQILTYLSTQNNIKVNSLWISNMISIKGANAELIETLSKMDGVDSIQEDEKIPFDRPVSTASAHNPAPNAIQWGIDMINAPSVWAQGYTGTGVVVGIIDTGVRYTHSSISHNYREDYGWFDPYLSTTVPDDADGHGTHTTGTLVGSGGIGVAPNATWFACRGCDARECVISAVQACGQFMLCPTLPDGTLEDCSKAPHIISNSWGSRGGRNFYDAVLKAWAAAGIIPVFSNGNFGSANCGTAGSPGDSRFTPVIAVGAVDSNETLANFTSIGPSFFGMIKPDIAAPGVNIVSASFTGDYSFEAMSGTSMACPHVSEAIALLMSNINGTQLTYEDVANFIYEGAEPTVAESGNNCGNISESVYPNNHVGHGRLNVLASLNMLIESRQQL